MYFLIIFMDLHQMQLFERRIIGSRFLRCCNSDRLGLFGRYLDWALIFNFVNPYYIVNNYERNRCSVQAGR